MTRAEMLAEVRTSLMQGFGSPLRDYGSSEDSALDKAADETAQATDCYYAEQVDDLVQDKARYCAPKIYKVKRYYVVDSRGDRIALPVYTQTEMDRWCSTWRSWPTEDVPRFVVRSGYTDFDVAPAAVETREGGLIVAGFALSTLPKSGRDTHQWDTADDECPLPAWAHDAVILRACYRRCRQLMARDPAAARLMEVYEQDWRRACGELSTQAAKAYTTIVRDNNGPVGGAYYYG